MLDFIKKEKGRMGRMTAAASLVGVNAGVLYLVAEVATAYAGAKYVALAVIMLNTIAAAALDLKKKVTQEPYVDEDDL